jgi:hypothetical protein
MSLEVGERPDFNQTGLDAPSVCEILWAEFTGWQPAIEGVQPYHPQPRVIEELPATTLDIYLVNLASAGGITITP